MQKLVSSNLKQLETSACCGKYEHLFTLMLIHPKPEPVNQPASLLRQHHMENLLLIFGLMTTTMFAVTFHAWRLGNDKRDVALLGAIGGLCGVGTAVAAIF